MPLTVDSIALTADMTEIDPDYPAESSVLIGVEYANGSLVGSLDFDSDNEPPAEADVREGVVYQVDGVVYVGTFEGGGIGNRLPGDRSPSITLNPHVGETIGQEVPILQDNGIPVDLSGAVLAVVFEDRHGDDVSVIQHGDIELTDFGVLFAYPPAVTATEQVLLFAVVDALAPRTTYRKGICNVTQTPAVDQ